MSDLKEQMKVPPRRFALKGWGIESSIPEGRVGEIFVYHTPQEDENTKMQVETVKVLYIETNKKLSYHLHLDKKEIFYIVLGQIELTYGTDTTGKDAQVLVLNEGESVLIQPKLIHSMKGLSAGINILLEISTLDKPEDSIRLVKGD